MGVFIYHWISHNESYIIELVDSLMSTRKFYHVDFPISFHSHYNSSHQSHPFLGGFFVPFVCSMWNIFTVFPSFGVPCGTFFLISYVLCCSYSLTRHPCPSHFFPHSFWLLPLTSSHSPSHSTHFPSPLDTSPLTHWPMTRVGGNG